MGHVGEPVALVHGFAAQLAYSNNEGDEAFWESVYRAFFPAFVSMSKNDGNNTAQRLGIDRWVHLGNGHVYRVDEKKRRNDHGDIAFEFEHVADDGSVRPGWIEKDLVIDFLAYGIPSVSKCYMLPFAPLRRAWGANRSAWFQAVGRSTTIAEARNSTYVSRSLCVPVDEVLRAVAEASRFQMG